MRKEIFIDVETNRSLDPQTGIITELAFIYRENGKIKKRKHITKNIYNTFVRELDTFVNKFDSEDKMNFIAYNASFDSDFIRQLFLRNKNKYYGSYFRSPAICIMQLAAFKFLGKKKVPANFKLGTVCKFMSIPITDNKLHNAMYDITKAKDLFNKLIKK